MLSCPGWRIGPRTCRSARPLSGCRPSTIAASDRLAAVQIALEDLDTQVSRFESEIDAVRQREERDRSLLQSGATDAKQLSDLQHELETLERRQASLEDSLLEVMEHREELQGQRTAELAVIEGLQADLASAQQALDAALAEIDQARESIRRDAMRWPRHWIPTLSALYERQRAGGGPAPGHCRATGAVPAGSRSAAASWPASRRPPRTTWCGARNAARSCCGSRASTSEGCHRGRRWISRQSRARPDTARWCGRADRSTVLAESKQAIGRATNNVAEYRGLIAGLDDAVKLGATEAAVLMDSKLVVEQMSGRWKVKHPDLVELHAQARALASQFDRISYAWIPRAQNSHADRLANEAMDAAADTISPSRNRRRPLPSPPKAVAAQSRPDGPAHAARRPGCCCCGTGRPSCRCSAATRGAATRR